MALGSLVWDASATMIDVPLENAINMVNNIFSTLMFSFSAIFWMCSTAAFCIRMWIFILNSTNIRKSFFFLTALVDCNHYKYIIIPNVLVFLNNEHAPQWMLCCQGSDGESLNGLCLPLCLAAPLISMHILDIMLNRFPKHMGSRELSDVWAEGRQKGPVDDHVFNGTMIDAFHLQGMWDSWPMCNRTLTPYHWQRPHASFGHLNYRYKPVLMFSFVLFFCLFNVLWKLVSATG